MGTTAEHPGKDSSRLLDIQIRLIPRLRVILSGSLVADDLRTVREALNDVLEPVGQAILELDLRRLVTCDGIAAAGLARMLARVQVDGGEVRLLGRPDIVSEIEQRAATWTDWRPGA